MGGKKRHTYEQSPAGTWCNVCAFPESNRGVHLLPAETDPGRDLTRANLRVIRSVTTPETSVALDATPESAHAGELARLTAGGLRRDIYELLGHPSRPGLATHEMQAEFQARGRACPWQSISARVAELVSGGVLQQAVADDGTPRTVLSPSLRPAAVWVLTPAARAVRFDVRKGA
jgi:hypothetical protein